jgi:Protein of unknown function (DUF2934)
MATGTSKVKTRSANGAASTRRRKSPAAASPDRHACIAEAAYFRSKQRGFSPGGEIEDWLAAEQEVDRRLRSVVRAS